jgi:small-conductance mechanosensitive channel
MKTMFIAAALLILCGPVLAQGSESPDWSKTDPQALEKELETAVAASVALGENNRAGAAAALKLSAIPEAEQAAWAEKVTGRIEALRELLRTLDERSRLLPAATIYEQMGSARVRLGIAEKASVPRVSPDADEEGLSRLREEMTRLREEHEAAERTYENRKAQLQLIRDEQRLLPARTQDLDKLLEDFTPARGDSLGVYERGNLEIRLRLARERMDFAALAVERWPVLLELRDLERRIAAQKAGQAEAVAQATAEALGQQLGVALTRAEVELRDALAAVPPTDPLILHQLRVNRDVLRFRVANKADERSRLEFDAAKARVEAVNDQVEERIVRLRERFTDTGGVSARTPELLKSNRSFAEESRTMLERRQLPELRASLRDNVLRRAEVQDLLVEASAVPLNTPEGLRKLIDEAGKPREAEARRAFEHGQEELRVVLQARYDVLNQIVQILLDTDKAYSARKQWFDDLETLVVRHMYWVQSDDPLGPATMTGIFTELTRIGRAYTNREMSDSVERTWLEGGWKFGVAFLVFVALIGTGFLLNRRLGRIKGRPHYAGGPLLVILQRLLVTAFLSLLAPVSLVLASLLLGLLNLPDRLAGPLTPLLLGLAGIWFFRRFLLAVFDEAGVAVQEMHAPADVAAQIRRAAHRVAGGLLFLGLPWWILRSLEVSPRLELLPRLLTTLMLIWFSFLLILMLRRRAPLVARIVGTEGLAFNLWGFVTPGLALGALGIVVMDVLGYRFGSQLLALNSLQTFLTALVLIGIYNLVTGLLEQTVKKFRDRRRTEVGAKEARAQAEAFSRQVVRAAGVGVIVLALALLSKYWGLGDGLRRFFTAMQITLIDEKTDQWLTGWDVLRAMLWVGAGHFLVAHLPGLLEVLLFSRFARLQAGTRFILMTIVRYATLFVAYSAAILSLHLSFSNLGWALAAVSLGVGFGMQEIISNFVSGLILFFERPIRVGDVVTVGTTTGTVDQINIRATHILNWDRQVIVIPNRKFISEEVVNWTHNDLVMRILIEIGVAYGTDVARVREVLFELVKAHPRVLATPPPRVWFWAFGDSTLVIRVFVFTELDYRVETINDLNLAISRRFAEEGIEIAFPQRDLHFRTVPDPALLKALGGVAAVPLTSEPEPLVPAPREDP